LEVGGCKAKAMCCIGVHMERSHGEVVMIKHSKEAAKKTCMIDRKAGGGAFLHGLVLHHGTKDSAGRWKVDGA
jgi:hypothetical protein